MRERNFCFTLNNYSDEEKLLLKIFFEKNCRYMVFGHEVGESGTPHLQGFLQLKNAKDLKVMIKKMPRRCNVSSMYKKSTSKFCMEYCKKDGDFVEYGVITQQGKRNDLAAIREHLMDGGTLREVIINDENPSLQKIQYAKAILPFIEPKRKIGGIEIYWHWGVSGAGKTYTVFKDNKNVFQPTTVKWFEGYDGHEVVLLDDFRSHMCEFNILLRIMDQYPFKVETKGGSREVKYNKLYITCPYHPNRVFNTSEDIYQIERRCTKIIHFTQKFGIEKKE